MIGWLGLISKDFFASIYEGAFSSFAKASSLFELQLFLLFYPNALKKNQEMACTSPLTFVTFTLKSLIVKNVTSSLAIALSLKLFIL
jgi:hypothetical protein